MKYLIVTGGTMSGLGKGTTISSIGAVLRSRGIRVTSIKIDPYLNLDAGTMSPYEHGEVYVLEDGGEVDLDLGNYERFLNITLTKNHNITTGKVYDKVLKKERDGAFLGKTVQVVPMITDEIQNWIAEVAKEPTDSSGEMIDVCLIEVGGTVGDIESAPYLEALQQMAYRVGSENFCLCHVALVPVTGRGQEQKTKPTQHSVAELRRVGLKPDFIFCRCLTPVDSKSKQKISQATQVPPEHVISVHDESNIYRVPLMIHAQNILPLICKRLTLTAREVQSPSPSFPSASPLSIESWESLAYRLDAVEGEDYEESVTIGLVGKYTGLDDAYLSVLKALRHAALESRTKLKIEWIDAEALQTSENISPNSNPVNAHTSNKGDAWDILRSVDGVICPGGFGDRGIEGKILAAEYCRTNKIPYLGICLGLQIAVIEFCRNVLQMDKANSTEFDPDTPHKAVICMPENDPKRMGGTMRLGNRATIIRDADSMAFKLYDQSPVIFERHRHRYEVNPAVAAAIERKGFKFVGQDEKAQRMEIAELQDHPFYLAVQFHPEFNSRLLRPSPPFLGLVLASSKSLEKRLDMGDGYLRPGSNHKN
eukprot:GHVO01052352.1.p1 GENE.GHVO01052352.1~~GHVO01052352.1.p1  ORF type:complete len:604 (-),score=93.33 GHVO01052352.1:179-1960(-)